jgi:phospholipase C
MMENRSFDHMLGQLSYPTFGNRKDVNGIRYPLKRNPAYENLYESGTYDPFIIKEDVMLIDDPPHERDEVTTQLAYRDVTGKYSMNGFVEAYFNHSINRIENPEVMGFFPPDLVPITTFLATNFAVCDRWFSSLPTSTVPNRLMAFSGDSLVDHTGGITEFFRPVGSLLLDWLEDRHIRWRVYHAGLSFFALLRRFDDVLGPNFRPFNELTRDVLTEQPDEFPQVIIIEPSYYDAPRLGDHPNDNHAPLAVGFGEQFLKDIYLALTSNPEKWSKMVTILTYDEHGGFFDHVSPLKIPYNPPNNNYIPFTSTGVRVPSIVVSPFVSQGSVYSEFLDHTSILQFIAERFDPIEPMYSDTVNKRKQAGIMSVSKVLNLSSPRSTIPSLPLDTIKCPAELGDDVKSKGLMQEAFRAAALQMINEKPIESGNKYPGLFHWKASYIKNNS